MSSSYVHLDGVGSYVYSVLNGYGWDIPNKVSKGIDIRPHSNFALREVFCRIFSVVHAAILMVTTTIKQAIRGCCFIVSGIFTCNGDYLLFGLKDLLAIPVQLVVLPIISLIGMISPWQAGYYGRYLLYFVDGKQAVNLPWAKHPNRLGIQYQPFARIAHNLKSHNIVLRILLTATSPIQTVVYLIEGYTRAIFSGDFGRWTAVAPCAFVCMPLCTLSNFENPREAETLGVQRVHGLYRSGVA